MKTLFQVVSRNYCCNVHSFYLVEALLTSRSYSKVSDLKSGAFVNMTVKKKDWPEWYGMRRELYRALKSRIRRLRLIRKKISW